MGEYVTVPEAHQDGTPHLHVAFNDVPIVVAFGGDYRAVQAFLQGAWSNAGGGFLWWTRPKASRPWAAAAELAKYVGKAIGVTPPWTDSRWCTVEDGFRKRPWHRVWASRGAGAYIRGDRPVVSSGEWKLVREAQQLRPRCPFCRRVGSCFHREAMPELVTSLGVSYLPWSPGHSVAIVPECDGHDPDPLVAFACHHAAALQSELGCWCRPPWLEEPPWSPPTLLDRLERTEAILRPFDLVDVDDPGYREPLGTWIRRGLRTFPPDRRRLPLVEAVRSGEDVLPTVTLDPTSSIWRCTCKLCLVAGAGCRSCPRCSVGVTT